ncbi:MAG TPA: hypothetical protein VF190_14670 [Rhodothermales bacterium]|jgi:hypothetical protein
MADIDVVPKHRSNAWLWWVIAIVILLLILWWAFSSTTPATPTTSLHHGATALTAALSVPLPTPC